MYDKRTIVSSQEPSSNGQQTSDGSGGFSLQSVTSNNFLLEGFKLQWHQVYTFYGVGDDPDKGCSTKMYPLHTNSML